MKWTIHLTFFRKKAQLATVLRWSNRRSCSKAIHFRGESRENGGVFVHGPLIEDFYFVRYQSFAVADSRKQGYLRRTY